MRVLILFASDHQQTHSIADAIGRRLGEAGHDVDVVDCRAALPLPEDYDAVLIGSRIHAGTPSRRLRRYVVRHRHELAAIPSGLFVVSLSAAATSGPGRADAQRCVDVFVRDTGWTPRWTASFGGALAYTRYGFLMRWMMKRFAAASQFPSDASRDHDLTDWSQVERFAAGVTADLAPHATALSGVPALPSLATHDRGGRVVN